MYAESIAANSNKRRPLDLTAMRASVFRTVRMRCLFWGGGEVGGNQVRLTLQTMKISYAPKPILGIFVISLHCQPLFDLLYA